MWFIRFIFFKLSLTLQFSCAVYLASINTVSATTIEREITLSKHDQVILKEALEEASKSHLKKAYALSKNLNDPLARKIIQYFYLVTQGTSGSFKQLSSFINENPHWPKMISLKSRAEEAISNNMSPQAVLDWFGSENPVSTDGWVQYIRALLAIGNKDKARRIIRETWITKNFSKTPRTVFL